MNQLTVGINIMSDGDRTVAEAVLQGYNEEEFSLEVIASGNGSSGREPGDKSRQSIGDALATARALRSLAARLEKRAHGAVKHAESNKAHKAEIALRDATLREGTPVVGSGGLGRSPWTPWATPLPVKAPHDF